MTERLRIPAVDDPDFVADVSYAAAPGGAELRLSGSATAAAAAAFAELLGALHAELRGRAERAIAVDLTGLERMAAPCVGELVAWVARLSALPPEERYQLRVRTSPQLAWQEHGLTALACFDTSVVRIER